MHRIVAGGCHRNRAEDHTGQLKVLVPKTGGEAQIAHHVSHPLGARFDRNITVPLRENSGHQHGHVLELDDHTLARGGTPAASYLDPPPVHLGGPVDCDSPVFELRHDHELLDLERWIAHHHCSSAVVDRDQPSDRPKRSRSRGRRLKIRRYLHVSLQIER